MIRNLNLKVFKPSRFYFRTALCASVRLLYLRFVYFMYTMKEGSVVENCRFCENSKTGKKERNILKTKNKIHETSIQKYNTHNSLSRLCTNKTYKIYTTNFILLSLSIPKDRAEAQQKRGKNRNF